MSLRTTIYRQLAEDEALASLLAEKPEALGPGPAIFESWAAPGAEMPYINLTYAFAAGNGVTKRTGSLDIDIFIDGYDTTRIEPIQKRVIQLLDLRHLEDPDDGPIRLYLDTEADIPEDEEGITHWNLTFSVIHWRKSFIAHLNNR
jgi:hypothetical protein